MTGDYDTLPPIEQVALAWLRECTDPDEGGWFVPMFGPPPTLTLPQFRAALNRLRKKGLAEPTRWNPGDGGFPVWLWFPVRTPAYDTPPPAELAPWWTAT